MMFLWITAPDETWPLPDESGEVRASLLVAKAGQANGQNPAILRYDR